MGSTQFWKPVGREQGSETREQDEIQRWMWVPNELEVRITRCALHSAGWLAASPDRATPCGKAG